MTGITNHSQKFCASQSSEQHYCFIHSDGPWFKYHHTATITVTLKGI